MGWETRKGGRYYYRKRRCGGMVTSEYMGSGEQARALAQQADADRQRSADRKAARHTEREKERALDALGEEIAALTTRALRASGYHQHRGQWRKRRA